MLGGLLATAGSSLLSSLIKRGTETASDSIMNKIEGVPTPPDPMSMGETGAQYNQFLNNAYPGTNSWDRLGASSPIGSLGAAEISSRSQQIMQEKELQTRERIADKSNIASVVAAASPQGAIGQESAVKTLMGQGLFTGSDYDTTVKQGRDILPARMAHERASARHQAYQARKVHAYYTC